LTHHCLILEGVKDSGRVPDGGYPFVVDAEGGPVSYVTSYITQCSTNRASVFTAESESRLRIKSENDVVEAVFRIVGIARNSSKSPGGGVGAS
jgi:hypothetical protein